MLDFLHHQLADNCTTARTVSRISGCRVLRYGSRKDHGHLRHQRVARSTCLLNRLARSGMERPMTQQRYRVQLISVSSQGGGTVDCSNGRWLIDSATVNIPDDVFLVGPWENLGGSRLSPVNYDYSVVDSAFIVNPTYTIKLARRNCGMRGLAVLRKGLVAPTDIRTAVDLAATFAGTGITIGDSVTRYAGDSYLGHLFVAGFNIGIASFCSRSRLEYISGDNINGIYMTTQLRHAALVACSFLAVHNSTQLSSRICCLRCC